MWRRRGRISRERSGEECVWVIALWMEQNWSLVSRSPSPRPSPGERFHGPRKAAICAPEPETVGGVSGPGVSPVRLESHGRDARATTRFMGRENRSPSLVVSLAVSAGRSAARPEQAAIARRTQEFSATANRDSLASGETVRASVEPFHVGVDAARTNEVRN